jgi:hypothetical protein
MRIYFTLPLQLIEDIDINFEGIKTDIDSLRLPPKSKRILHAVKNLIEVKFASFNGDIEFEENKSDETYILMDFTNHPLEIKYLGYSTSLKAKMRLTFDYSDLDIIEKELGYI